MENSNRDESAKPTSARKKKSVELHLMKRKAFADRNVSSIPVRQSLAAACGKENDRDWRLSSQYNSTALKNRNSNEMLPKATAGPSLVVAWKRLQNLPVITESEDTADVDDPANVIFVRDKDSVLKKENESHENSVFIFSLKNNQENKNVCDLSTRSEPSKKSKRNSSLLDYLERLLYVEDYKKDIVQYLEEREKELCLQNVPSCSQFPKLHAVIVNWLTKLLSDLDWEDELLFITITLLDRLFTKVNISVNKLQLAAMACLWIAIKQNINTNISAPELITTCKVTASVKELIAMERILLKKLNFNITVIEPMLFVNYYLNEMKINERRIKQTCKYMLDIILLNSEYSMMYPSLIGSAAVYAALSICGRETLWEAMQQNAGCHKPCQFSYISDTMLSELKMICLDQAKFRAAYSKHRKLKNGKISKRLVVKQNEVILL